MRFLSSVNITRREADSGRGRTMMSVEEYCERKDMIWEYLYYMSCRVRWCRLYLHTCFFIIALLFHDDRIVYGCEWTEGMYVWHTRRNKETAMQNERRGETVQEKEEVAEVWQILGDTLTLSLSLIHLSPLSANKWTTEAWNKLHYSWNNFFFYLLYFIYFILFLHEIL